MILNRVLTSSRVSIDRQLQHAGSQDYSHMSSERTADESTAEDATEDSVTPRGAPDISELDAKVDTLKSEFEGFEADIEERTVDKDSVESELKRYVRKRTRRGHARGWGPYLVLLYGTVMTLGAFYLFNSDWLAILAMLIIFLSTLGLYTLFVLVGVGFNLIDVPGKAIDLVRDRRN